MRFITFHDSVRNFERRKLCLGWCVQKLKIKPTAYSFLITYEQKIRVVFQISFCGLLLSGVLVYYVAYIPQLKLCNK